jgi:hypothetical protein
VDGRIYGEFGELRNKVEMKVENTDEKLKGTNREKELLTNT